MKNQNKVLCVIDAIEEVLNDDEMTHEDAERLLHIMQDLSCAAAAKKRLVSDLRALLRSTEVGLKARIGALIRRAREAVVASIEAVRLQ